MGSGPHIPPNFSENPLPPAPPPPPFLVFLPFILAVNTLLNIIFWETEAYLGILKLPDFCIYYIRLLYVKSLISIIRPQMTLTHSVTVVVGHFTMLIIFKSKLFVRTYGSQMIAIYCHTHRHHVRQILKSDIKRHTD